MKAALDAAISDRDKHKAWHDQWHAIALSQEELLKSMQQELEHKTKRIEELESLVADLTRDPMEW